MQKSWRDDPLVLLGAGSDGFRIWPFDPSLTSVARDNAVARDIVIATGAASIAMRQPRLLATGAALLAGLFVLPLVMQNRSSNPSPSEQSHDDGSNNLSQQLPTNPGFGAPSMLYSPLFIPTVPQYPREGYWQGQSEPTTWVPSPYNGVDTSASTLDNIYQHGVQVAGGDYWSDVAGSISGSMNNGNAPLHQTPAAYYPPDTTWSMPAVGPQMPPDYINTTSLGPVPQHPSIAVPPNANTIDETAFDPSLASNPFVVDTATRLAGHQIQMGRNAANPYGNPLPYDAHYAADGSLPRQPNEMDVHFETFKSAQRDIKKMFGPGVELDEGLFINPLPDPTLMARPVNFVESSEFDRHIVGDFVSPYRQTM